MESLQKNIKHINLGLLFVLLGLVIEVSYIIGPIFIAIGCFNLIKVSPYFKKAGISAIVIGAVAIGLNIYNFFFAKGAGLAIDSTVLTTEDTAVIIEYFNNLEPIALSAYIEIYIETVLFLLQGLAVAFTITFLGKGIKVYTDRYCNSLSADCDKALKAIKFIPFVYAGVYALTTLSSVLSFNAVNTLILSGVTEETLATALASYLKNLGLTVVVAILSLVATVWNLIACIKFKKVVNMLANVVPLDSQVDGNAIDVDGEFKF